MATFPNGEICRTHTFTGVLINGAAGKEYYFVH